MMYVVLVIECQTHTEQEQHSISAEKCSGPYVSRYIANLTLAQVKEMDCDIQLPGYPQQESKLPSTSSFHPPITTPRPNPNKRPVHRGSTIQTLEEILDLINCYGDSGFRINLETKLDPTAPNQTLSVETYINDLIPILQRRGFASRTTIQSFDWRTLIGIKRKWPETVTVALLDDTTVVRDPTASIPYPWLGGVNLDSFGGDWVAAAHSIDAGIVSPVHGVPSNATVNTIGYKAFVTRANTQRAHQLGMQMVPWTVNDESTMSKLVDDGVDAIISDYPERVLSVARQRGISVGRARARSRPACLARADS